MKPALTLYIDGHFLSPYAMFAYVALREKGLPFHVERVDLDAHANHDPLYQQRSLTSRVPTLSHGDFSLSESSAIIEYLEEVFAPPQYAPVLATPVRQRARARQIQAWLRSDLAPLRQERPTTLLFGGGKAVQALSQEGRAAAHQLIQVAQQLLGESPQTLFDRWSIVDTELALMLHRMVAAGDLVPPALQAYVAKQWARPSVQQWCNHELA